MPLPKHYRGSATRIGVMSAVLVAHALGYHALTRYTRLEPTAPRPDRMEVSMELFETLPIAPPAERTVPTPPDRPTPVAIRPAPQRTRPPAATPPAATSTAIDAQRLQNQMRDVAAGMAREKAPHNALSKRDLQAFVPDRESDPDLRFEVNPEASPGDQLNRVLKMLQGSLPQAAFDLDAPSDLLTEGWERAHHSSDLAACMREYRRFDEDLQRQLCGEVRP